jgi:hypothetical protein
MPDTEVAITRPSRGSWLACGALLTAIGLLLSGALSGDSAAGPRTVGKPVVYRAGRGPLSLRTDSPQPAARVAANESPPAESRSIAADLVQPASPPAVPEDLKTNSPETPGHLSQGEGTTLLPEDLRNAPSLVLIDPETQPERQETSRRHVADAPVTNRETPGGGAKPEAPTEPEEPATPPALPEDLKSTVEAISIRPKAGLASASAANPSVVRQDSSTLALAASINLGPDLAPAATEAADLPQPSVLEAPAEAAEVGQTAEPSLSEDELTIEPGQGAEEIGAGFPLDELVPLRDVQIRLATAGEGLPKDDALVRFGSRTAIHDMPGSCRGWSAAGIAWEAPALCHWPLYFEEVGPERHGHKTLWCTQPVVSAAHFFATVPALPYLMYICPPRECQYTLGHYRPGDYVPYHCNRIPLNARAGLVEGGVITGLIFLIP